MAGPNDVGREGIYLAENPAILLYYSPLFSFRDSPSIVCLVVKSLSSPATNAVSLPIASIFLLIGSPFIAYWEVPLYSEEAFLVRMRRGELSEVGTLLRPV